MILLAWKMDFVIMPRKAQLHLSHHKLLRSTPLMMLKGIFDVSTVLLIPIYVNIIIEFLISFLFLKFQVLVKFHKFVNILILTVKLLKFIIVILVYITSLTDFNSNFNFVFMLMWLMLLLFCFFLVCCCVFFIVALVLSYMFLLFANGKVLVFACCVIRKYFVFLFFANVNE